jgi:hypothetical protein
MSAKDVYHDATRRALEKDGWTITHDPLIVTVGGTDLEVDIGAERMLAAERNGERIAVEVKSFLKPSPVQDLKEASGQFLIYEQALSESRADADRTLYLAVRRQIYNTTFQKDVGAMLLRHHSVRLVVFDENTEEIIQWIN